jgi:hypothetical protein
MTSHVSFLLLIACAGVNFKYYKGFIIPAFILSQEKWLFRWRYLFRGITAENRNCFILTINTRIINGLDSNSSFRYSGYKSVIIAFYSHLVEFGRTHLIFVLYSIVFSLLQVSITAFGTTIDQSSSRDTQLH